MMTPEVDRDELIGKLKTGIVQVTFEKLDGTIRQMSATLDESIIPQEVLLAVKDRGSDSPGVLSVFDVDKKAWRAFRLHSIIRLNSIISLS